MAAGTGLRNALTATLTYMRRNRAQAEIAENYGVSQPMNSTPGLATSRTVRCSRAGRGRCIRNCTPEA
jgi:hypothetical protein